MPGRSPSMVNIQRGTNSAPGGQPRRLMRVPVNCWEMIDRGHSHNMGHRVSVYRSSAQSARPLAAQQRDSPSNDLAVAIDR